MRIVPFCLLHSVPALLLIVFSLEGCAPSNYLLVTENYTPTEVDSRSKKMVIIRDRYVDNAQLFAGLINEHRWTIFDKEIEKIEDVKVQSFLMSVRLMVDTKYSEALQALSHLEDSDFDCQVKILKIDCLFELKSNSANFLKEYQDACDCASDDVIKSIAIKRHRFVKYGI